MFILLTALLIWMCTACTSEDWYEKCHKEVIIYGSSVDESGIDSRAGSVRLLETGTRISLYAKGGIQTEGQILTLQHTTWQAEQSLQWTESQSSAEVCAYTPPLATYHQQLYQMGQLQDMLIAQKKYYYPKPICLCFEHLFAKINFHMEEGQIGRAHV